MNYNLSVEDAKLLLRIYKAPGRTIYYYSGILDIPRTTLSNKINMLHDLGFLKRRTGTERKYLYFVSEDVKEQAVNILNPDLEKREGDDDDEQDNAGANNL